MPQQLLRHCVHSLRSWCIPSASSQDMSTALHLQADEAAAYNDTNHREATDLGAAAGSAPESPAVAIVSNHCGWTDILVHMARSFPSFVARADTIQLTMIGLIRYFAGCPVCRPHCLLCCSS